MALRRTNGRLSALALRARAEPEAALASHVFVAPPCGGVVRAWRFGLSDSVDAAGARGSSRPPIRPNDLLKNVARVDPRVGPFRARSGGRSGRVRRRRRRGMLPAFAKDVFINQERKLGARRRSDTVLVSTINDADQGSADVAFRTPPAPYEKSKFLGSGGSMVARLKLKGIDGRAPPGVEPAA
ncbi:hypothetical protein RND71_019089 [Anisodus tanguticus]|uniref:rRNA intron-encoded homing endonuclease n=1 Tax=Anisodus tanguticus TaxID=243964 RepID=A0AAE1RZX2_9SOLA|nr:hypothetical protein RND71_019089 [Anisodus tanguticus]